MHNMKFRVESQEHRTQIRQELYRLGIGLLDEFYPYEFIFTYLDKSLMFSSSHEMFEYSDHTETTLDQLKQMK